MKSFNFTSFNPIAGRAQAAIAVALLVGAGLTGCGGSSDDHGNNGGDGTPAPVDAFTAAVSDLLSSSSDTIESNPIDDFVTTSPENTEPEPFG